MPVDEYRHALFLVLDKPTFAGPPDEHAAAPGRGKTG